MEEMKKIMDKQRIKLDYNNLMRNIDDTLSNSRSKIVRENEYGIMIGIQLLSAYLKEIAERAIEINDDVLIDILCDLNVLTEAKGNE